MSHFHASTIFILTLIILPHSAAAFECPPFEAPEVIVRPLLGQPNYDFSRSLGTLLAMGKAEDRTRFSNTEHETPVGLTAASLKFKTHYQIITNISPNDNSVCAQIKNFTLDFGFNDTIVYVARELPRNSCSFKEVLEHELKHVHTDRQLVKIYAKKFQPMFSDLVRGIGTVHSYSSNNAEQKIKHHVKTYISGLSKSLAAVREKYQTRVDTKAEYERLRRSCNGDLEKIIRKYKFH